jgi:hypothetical protein
MTDVLDGRGGWVFEPARIGGKPLSVYYDLTVNFR